MVLFIVLASSMIVFSAGLTPDPENLPNFQQPRTQIYTAGQPTETGFREVASMGVKTVINVLPEKECLPGEDKMVNDRRMTYVTLPFETTGFKVETVKHFSTLLKKSQKPMLIHCSTGNHVGGLWFAYRVLTEKAPVTTALQEARRIGLKPSLEDGLVKWVAQQHGKVQTGR
ncbi:MAG TPA: sulfur transferase domain-containing protein [Acidobacteriota bacterium]|nr:sulfur transferase domain-containing protein [Acidobacteriota bacterium]